MSRRQSEDPAIEEAPPGVRHIASNATACENRVPVGQAALWFADVLATPIGRSGTEVARQLARLGGDDSVVTTTTDNLADAVGYTDILGRQRAFTERGVQALLEAGFIEKEVIGKGRLRRTTFHLLPVG